MITAVYLFLALSGMVGLALFAALFVVTAGLVKSLYTGDENEKD